MGKRLTNALPALTQANFRLAVVSLHPLLIEALLKLLPSGDFSVSWLNGYNRDLLSRSVIVWLEKFE